MRGYVIDSTSDCIIIFFFVSGTVDSNEVINMFSSGKWALCLLIHLAATPSDIVTETEDESRQVIRGVELESEMKSPWSFGSGPELESGCTVLNNG